MNKAMTPKNINRTHSTYSWWYYLLPPLILAVVTAAFYYPSLHYSFQFDDIANITKHFNIRHYTLRSLFLTGSRWISYWINAVHFSIGGFDPFSYRVGDVFIHLINGTLLFFILFAALQRVKTSRFFAQHAFYISFLTSALFLLHPVQTQTVSYVIQGQLEGFALMGILSMTACFLFSAYTTSKNLQIIAQFCLFVCAVLACGTKEIAIMAPALIALIDWFFVAQGNWSSFKKRLLLHASLLALMGAIFVWFLKPQFFLEVIGFQKVAKNNIGNIITSNPTDLITPWGFFISQFKVILHYLWIFIWPLSISVEYDWVLSRSFFAPDSFLPFLALIVIAYGVLKIFRNNVASPIAFGAVWFFCAILPRSSFIPSPELLVDYKTYTASCGWLLLLAAAITYASVRLTQLIAHQRLARLGNPAVATLCILLLGFGTMKRNTIWRSGMEFWGNMIENAPNKARAYNNYGVELSQSLQKFEESVPYFKKAINMDKNYPDPWNNVAVAYASLGKTDLAIDALKEGLRINPYYPEGYNNIASFYLQKGDYDKAEKSLQTALKLRPHYGKAYYNLARLHTQRGDKEKAWEAFKNSCTKGDFDNEHGFAAYGRASLELKKLDDAIFAFNKTLQINPNYTGIWFNLGNAYFMAKKYEKAIASYKETISRHMQEAEAIFNIGETYYITKNYQEALIWFNKLETHKQRLPQFYMRRAQCLEQLGDLNAASTTLTELINMKTDDKNPLMKNTQDGARLMLAHLSNAKMAKKRPSC